MMKTKFLAALVLCVGVSAAVEAFAADVSTVHDWSGFYAGINAGVNQNTYHNTDLDYYWNGADNTLQPYSVAPGIKAGYNWQFGQLVVGVEGDYNLNLGSSSKETLCGAGCAGSNLALKGELDSYGSLRARGGFAIDRVLLYLTAGGAYGEGSQKAESRCPGQYCSSDYLLTWDKAGSLWGVTAGAGAEYALTDRVSVNAEYLHTTFLSTVSSATCVFGSCPSPTNAREKIWPELDSIRIGVSYKFTDFGL